jgi:hypothetical protein
MDLKNMLKHKAGTVVLVNGHEYQIGLDGILRNVPQEDADKLLKNRAAWIPLGPSRAPVVPEAKTESKPEPAAQPAPVSEVAQAPVVEAPAEVETSKPVLGKKTKRRE